MAPDEHSRFCGVENVELPHCNDPFARLPSRTAGSVKFGRVRSIEWVRNARQINVLLACLAVPINKLAATLPRAGYDPSSPVRSKER